MRILSALVLAVLLLLPSVASTAPLDAEQVRLVKQLGQRADNAEKALATEHAAHLDAEKDAAASKTEAVKLGEAAATSAAQRDAAIKERDTADSEKWRAYGLLAASVLGFLVLIAAAGSPLEALLRAEIKDAGHLLLVAIQGVRLGLKTAFPTILFWL